jgi:hypothetical protein
VCISSGDDVTQFSIIPVLSSAAFCQWSETVSRVPLGTLRVVMLMTLCFILRVEYWVNHSCCAQHCLGVLYVCIDFFIVFWPVGV